MPVIGCPIHPIVKVSLIFALAAFVTSEISRAENPPGVSPASRPATSPCAERRFEYIAPKMGTVFRIVMYCGDEAAANQAADAAWARVDQLNALLSDYDPNSELSKLSQRTLDGPMTRAVPVSADVYQVLERSVEAAKLSEGTFDVTVGPLTQLFRRSRRLEMVPTPSASPRPKKGSAVNSSASIPNTGPSNFWPQKCGWTWAGLPRDMPPSKSSNY